ncbi:MAG TPA: glycosyltransferase family 87 protein, partial [Chloroflexota bacterium]|nr:glycosyltransferase family 87 protein [Chloroflexota bacterium]
VNLPPITLLLLFAPFTVLSDLAGKLAYFALNHATFLSGLALLAWALRPPKRVVDTFLWTAAAIAAASAFEPWHDSLRLGQQNGVVFFCLAISAVATTRRQDTLSGIFLAAALIGKPSSALLGIYFILARRWRTVIAAGAAGILAFAITLPWAGVENWRFYLMEKAPEILAGTPQQSNVALLALHARLFLPSEALASFDAMPALPLAVAMTRAAQLLGLVALWRLVTRCGRQQDSVTLSLEFAFTLVLSLSLVGHAWQSYLTWLVVAFVPLADPRPWMALSPRVRRIALVLAAAAYASMAINDVTLHRVTGSTSWVAALFASLPTLALLVLAFLLALLLRAHESTQEGAMFRN